MAKRSVADECYRPAGAISPDSPTARPLASVGSCPVHRRDTAITGGAVPPLPGGVNNGAFSARGTFGQFIFVNPTEQVVIAIQSAWRQPQDSDAELEIVAMIRAAVSALRTEPAT